MTTTTTLVRTSAANGGYPIGAIGGWAAGPGVCGVVVDGHHHTRPA
jgi:hypothetical protein